MLERTITCADCGATASYKTKPPRYCGPCATRRRRSRDYEHRQGVSLVCVGCSVAFIKTGPGQSYCTDACRLEVYRKSLPMGTPQTIVCPGCDQTVPKTNAAQKWCSRKCYYRFRAGERSEIQFGTMLICIGCGGEFTKSHSQQRYCSLSCQYEVRHPVRMANQRARYHSDPRFAINGRISRAIWGSLRNGKEGRPWETLVGYTITDLMRHLEDLFAPGMNWDNRGQWHIDHKRPLSSFSFTTADDPEFRQAWALSNLQPLWAFDNISKKDRWVSDPGDIGF
jgi:hypothetical protein